jgi:hypothetical protein
MGATSATGVGNGAAGVTRGPGNLRDQYASLLDPHVVWHGKIYIDSGNGGDAQIDLPSNIKDVPEKLTILCSGKAYAVTKNLDGDGLVESFEITGTKKREVDFIVIKSPSALFTPEYNP